MFLSLAHSSIGSRKYKTHANAADEMILEELVLAKCGIHTLYQGVEIST
jgi:hypothetical protein